MTVNSVAVLGAGTMGAQIALHCANAGLPVHLLDLSADDARAGLQRACALSPDPSFTEQTRRLVTPGGFDADIRRLADVDWIVEAIVEQADAKRALLARVDEVRTAGTIVSSNTSGLSLASLADGRSDDFRARWLGTHFFNPPRYLHLLEIVPTPDTAPETIAAMAAFADRVLGKGVVVARDTPGFIANRLGAYGVARVLAALDAGRHSIEEIDAMTGTAIGRPASATFRTIDMAGLDILAAVFTTLRTQLPGPEGQAFATPPVVDALVSRGRLGEKTQAGFYKRIRGADGRTEILTLDPETLEYRPRRPASFASLDMAAAVEDIGVRLRTLFRGADPVAAFLRDTLAPMLMYTALVAPDIANTIDDIDRAMRWGFGWERGPFELFDAIGVTAVAEAAAAAGWCRAGDWPPLVADVLARGTDRFREAPLPQAAPGVLILREARARERIVRRNSGASLVDLGDGVLCVEFHSKLNTIGGDAVEMLAAGVAEAEQSHAALIVGNDAPHFSAGANLLLVLLEAQEGNWDEVDQMVRAFQAAVLGLKYSAVPVVAAPAGLALGGGAEIVLHADRVQAAAETYIGLVETGVGLIPAGGGTTEMVARAGAGSVSAADILANLEQAFKTIALATVSRSAPDAARLGYLRPADGVTMNRERVMADAKARALARVAEGYRRPPPAAAVRVGGDSVKATLELGVHLALRAGRASEHDALVGRTLAHVMAGGSLPHATMVSEDYLLELEREAFLSLVGQPKTLDRIRHTLKTGKALRN